MSTVTPSRRRGDRHLSGGSGALRAAPASLATLVSTSVSAQVLDSDPYPGRHRVLPGQLVPPVHRAARAPPTAPHPEQLGHAAVVANLSGGLQALLMVAGLLGVALAVDPAAAIAVIGMGIVLSQILRPLNQRTRRNNRRALQDHAGHGHTGDRVHPPESGLPVVRCGDPGHRQAQRVDPGHQSRLPQDRHPQQHRARPVPVLRTRIHHRRHRGPGPVPGTRGSPSSEPSSSSCCDPSATARALQSSIMGLRSNQGMLEDVTRDLRRFEDAQVVPESACPSPSRWTSIPWSTPTTG